MDTDIHWHTDAHTLEIYFRIFPEIDSLQLSVPASSVFKKF